MGEEKRQQVELPTVSASGTPASVACRAERTRRRSSSTRSGALAPGAGPRDLRSTDETRRVSSRGLNGLVT
ncbi:hypothetical protein FHU38_000802 [Saccharomonospora amisosensis]|uniref:Uncharacterized protein n=1 Tax=Saccharomonospora amisosensis TaxID=1128677 RepID=A0A7X5ULY3_9PSEU|nr:hypothetical protein [Saccharomonospora amisosensis]